jgi:fatty-acid desaturase
MAGEEEEVGVGKMTLREVVEVRPITKKKIDNLRRLFLEVLQVFIQTILPFVCGYYFNKTGNLIFAVIVLIVMAFNITILEKEC